MTFDKLRSRWTDFTRGDPGSRFQDRYRRHRRRARKEQWLMRLARFAIAGLAIVIGLVLAVLPGPAVLFFLLAGGLLASEWLWMAKLLDWAELRARDLGRFVRRFWKRLPSYGRVALILTIAGISAASTWGIYQWVR